jgi:hypothetical protein
MREVDRQRFCAIRQPDLSVWNVFDAYQGFELSHTHECERAKGNDQMADECA